MNRRTLVILAMCAALGDFSASPVLAEVRPHALFSEGMVLQRDTEDRVDPVVNLWKRDGLPASPFRTDTPDAPTRPADDQ
jgi:hypothetical protein